jgi:hypothetical protein
MKIYKKQLYDIIFKEVKEFLLENNNLDIELDEISAEKKRGIKLPKLVEILEPYIDKDYYIQFSDIEKLGIYPHSNFNTPIGIYCYPLTKDIYKLLLQGKLPFAQERKYLILFKAKNPQKMWDVSRLMKRDEYEKFLLKIKKIYKSIIPEYDDEYLLLLFF